MKTNEYMEQTEQYVLHTYNRFPLVIDHGEGVHLYDTDGKAYLDFAAGIAVYALGYSNDDYKKAVKDQVDKVIMFPTCSTMFRWAPRQKSWRRHPAWIKYSLRTAVRSRSREPSK